MTAVEPVPTWDGRGVAPELGDSDVHVWLVELDVEPDGLDHLLSPVERERADAFRFELHRSRFIVGRGRLRELLAAYTGRPPARLELREGPNGKPELAEDVLRFNVSHCEGLALLAIARREVGVDLELVERPRRPRWPEIAARFFHADEHRLVAGWLEFLRIWTLKESCLKAVGVGLLTDPRTFSVAEVLAGENEMVRLAGAEWRVRELAPSDGALAALAVAV